MRDTDDERAAEKLTGQEKRLLVELIINDIIKIAKEYRLNLFEDEDTFKVEARQLLRGILDRGYPVDYLPPLCISRS
jgi:hypothetical protein